MAAPMMVSKWHIAAVEAKNSQVLLWVIEEDIIICILI